MDTIVNTISRYYIIIGELLWTDGLVFWMNNTIRYKFHSWVAETCLNQTLDKMSQLTRCTSVYNPNRYEKKYEVCSCNLYFPVFPIFLGYISIFRFCANPWTYIYHYTNTYIYTVICLFALYSQYLWGKDLKNSSNPTEKSSLYY